MKTTRIKQTLAALFSAVCFSTLASAQITDAVYSVNVIGMQKQPVVQNLQMMSNPFERMTIKDLVGNSGVYGNAEDVADNVIIYDAAQQKYGITYYLRLGSSPTGVPEWRGPGFWATNTFVEPGQGFFYRSRLTVARTNSVVGDVIMAGAATNTIRPGLQLLSYPFSTRVRLSDLNLKSGVYANAEDVADNIIIYNPAITNYVTYYLRLGSSPTGLPEWRGPGFWATNVYLEAGQGFFFRSRGAEAYSWVEQTPYPDL